MTTHTNHTDAPYGARFTFLLIPLFAAAALAMLGIVYPMLIGDALQAHMDAAPLANPELTITSKLGDPLYMDETTLSRLSDIGNPVTVVRCDAETAHGLRIRLQAVDGSALQDCFVLTDGRLPQNETECVIVPLDSDTGVEIGSAIRPCGKNGEVLIDRQNGTPCSLTVVGIGKNVLSTLAPITDSTVQLLVYTTSDQCWQNPDTTALVYLTDCRCDDPITALAAIDSETAASRDAYRMSIAEQNLQSCIAAAEQADNAVIAHEITVQTIENRLNTANLRVSEAETVMMDAIAALQAEKQQFVSDMEYNEYYALRQVDLIPRRDRAEEGYAKQEAVIAQMNETLHAAYAERDAISAELQSAAAILAELQSEANAVHEALNEQKTRNAQSAHPQSWSITTAEQHSAYAQLQSHAAAIRNTAFLMCAAALGIYLVGSITVYAVSRKVTCSVPRALLSSILTAIPAILFGGCLLTEPILNHTYPVLRGNLTVPIVIGDILHAGAAVLLFTAVTVLIVSAVGHRIQRIPQTNPNH